MDGRPIPEPPGTPTPPPDDDPSSGMSGPTSATISEPTYDPNALSPPLDHGFGSMSVPLASPASTNSIYSSMSIDSSSYPTSAKTEDGRSPFNFQPTSYTVSKSPVKSNVGQRRGHKYKRSSVSHQIFLEPPPRAPLTVPNSLPTPTLKECRASMSKEQTTRLWWSFCHMFVAGYTLWSGHGSLAMEALSRLIFYDSLGALLCVVVDVLGNFEVWKRSSIRHPFGLERAELLAGFAMSVLLLFMGFDLISHNSQHLLEGIGSHEPHDTHTHDRVSPGEVDITAVLAIASTLISATVLKNHARIGKAMRFASMQSLPSVLSNPSHFLTLSCSTLLLLLPMLSFQVYSWIDKILSCTIALAMSILGFRLVFTLGSMLLMSYSPHAVSAVVESIRNDSSVIAVEDAKFWQVHYGLCIASLKIRARGTEETLLRLRERLTSLIRNRLGGGYGSGGQRWETTIEFVLEGYRVSES